MTEAEWQAGEHPDPMLEFLRGGASDRKLRMFGVACCRAVLPCLGDDRSRRAVEVAERHAEEALSEEELETVRRDAGAAFKAAITPACREANAPRTAGCAGARAALLTLLPTALEAAASAAYQAANAARRIPGVEFLPTFIRAHLDQSRLLRDIVGNPFRPVTFDSTWLTSDVVLLARGIYEERAFDRMPILADALQEAGCTNDDVLNHCRDAEQTHVRGCWVVDRVLGK